MTQHILSMHEVLELARRLSPIDKLKLIEGIAPDLEAALSRAAIEHPATSNQDDRYQQGYERIPEDIADVAALVPHLAIPPERWE